jgi:D-3-phosphoglycerate dehydrogenase
MKVIVIKKPANKDMSIEEERRVLEPNGIVVESRVLVSEEEIILEAKDASGLIVANAGITRKVLASLPALKVVVKAGVGLDNIDLQAAAELGKCVANVPDGCTEEVALHALTLALMGVKRIHTLDRRVREGRWGIDFKGEPVFRLSEMDLGLIGFGRISRKLALYSERLVRGIRYYDPYVVEADDRSSESGCGDPAEPGSQYKRTSTADEIFESCKIVSLHTPLTEETRGMINRRLLDRARGIVLVNTGRAPLVDRADIVRALDEKQVTCFCSDVFWYEPANYSDPWQCDFLRRQDVIITPHAASFSVEGFKEVRRKSAEEILRVLKGEQPLNAKVPPAS